MYKVLRYFADLQDNDFAYRVGDIFPRAGMKVSKRRIAELSGSDNNLGEPLIALVEDQAQDKEEKPRTRRKRNK